MHHVEVHFHSFQMGEALTFDHHLVLIVTSVMICLLT